MPYINKEKAEILDNQTLGEIFDKHSVGGDLNYALCTLIRRFLETRMGHGGEGTPRYSDMEDVMGAFRGAHAEFYRLVVAPYEDRARRTGADPFYCLEKYARNQADNVLNVFKTSTHETPSKE